jgi:N-acetylmuramoyl-L-alanine amidase
MSTGIKNGKDHTINIYIMKLFFCLAFLVSVPASGIDSKDAKEWVIVIDAGHGGKDPGAVGSVSYEKNIALAVALRTGEYIEQNIKNVKVIYTRKTDVFIEVKERANIANRNKADLFISIHANLTQSKSVHGAETFVMGLAKDQQNLEVAMKENEVILLEKDYSTSYEGFDPKSPESYIMFTLMQDIYHEQSTGLASKIQTEYSEKINRADRGVKQAGFWVLFMTTMPSVLTELGFISNAAEEKFMISGQGQEFLASAIFRACREYILEIDSKSVAISDIQKPNSENTVKIPPTDVAINRDAIFFMVQVATSANKTEIKTENFKGLSDITEIESTDRFKYAAGKFPDYSAAVRYRKKLETLYPDAFVIAVKDNKILPLQQALEQKKKR